MNTYSSINHETSVTAYSGASNHNASVTTFNLKAVQQYLLRHWKSYLLKETLRKERLALAELSEAQLADIGITRGQAKAESDRVWGDVPSDRQIGR